MAPFHFRGMKGVNISCASPASTATCSSMDPRRSVSRHGRAIDRLQAPGPHLRDSRWAASALNWVPPSPSKLKSYAHKGRKSSEAPANLVSPAASSRYLLGDDDAFFDVFPDLDPLPAFIPINSARFRSVTGDDDSPALKPSSSSSVAAAASRVGPVCLGASSSSSSSSTSSLPPARLLQITKGDGSPALGPPASTRPPYLDHLEPAAVASPPSPRFEIVQGDDDSAVIESPPGRLLQGHAFFRASSSLSETRFHTTKGEDSAVLKPSSSARARDQVVVLRVSLHCKGCEAKVKKHISRMEGVTSFNIDFATKKVTVIGDVTPLGVLSSISKVKNAQFWPSPPRSSSSS